MDAKPSHVCKICKKGVTPIGGFGKKTQTSNQTESGQSSTRVQDTPDIIAARQNKAQLDPSIGYRLGEAQRNLKETYQNPMGGYATPQIRDAVLRSGSRELAQQAGQQTREGQYDVNRLNQNRDLALAGLTRGTDTTSSGTSSGKVTEKDPWGTAIKMAGLSL